jgi:hypothetical protein
VAWLDELHPIRLFSFYLALFFFISTGLRVRQYQAVLSLVTRLRNRWPNLTRLLLGHRHIFLTWNTLLPLLLTLAVFLVNYVAGRYVWPQADRFTVAELREVWPLLAPVLGLGACMLILDVVGAVWVGEIDVKETESYFDLAEKWLTGWRAPVVNWLSLGYVNPRQMVNEQVREALLAGSRSLNVNLWWLVGQTVWRLAFGLSLWVGYVCWRHEWLAGLLD